MGVGASFLTVAVAALLAVASPLGAQPAAESGPRVSGFFTGSFGDGGARPGFAVSAGYRFSRYAGFEFDIGYINGLRLSGERGWPVPLSSDLLNGICWIPEGCPTLTVHDRGDMLTFTANYVVEIPIGIRWLRPYFLGGGGVANISRNTDFFIGDSVAMGSQTGLTRMYHLGGSDTSLNLDAGGGVDFLITHDLAIGGDVRYFHVFSGWSGIDMARVGARFSYRF